jgi:hypothetical protein
MGVDGAVDRFRPLAHNTVAVVVVVAAAAAVVVSKRISARERR